MLSVVGSEASGLSDAEAARRLGHYGPNLLTATPAKSVWRILVRQVQSVVVGLLVVAAVLAWWTSDVVDAGAILAVLFLNVGIGFATEFRARRAMDALLRLDVPNATVVRQGSARTVDARQLVPGDVVELEPGQALPADARLLSATALQTIEASLTGESTAVAKSAEAELPADTPLPDRVTMVYKGTTVADGVARAVVVATGMQTEVGRIGKLVSTIGEEPTLLERRLDSLGRRLAAVAVGVGILMALVALYRGDYLAAVLQTGIAVAIAAVPEGLPAVVTMTMAIATRRMARRHALVRRLPAVETLGSVTVVCTDKTGTLTAGQQIGDDDVVTGVRGRCDRWRWHGGRWRFCNARRDVRRRTGNGCARHLESACWQIARRFGGRTNTGRDGAIHRRWHSSSPDVRTGSFVPHFSRIGQK